jgi:predicted ATPase/class 3 adenylate cyclase/DNA-binding CsgD family transcriptional regulator
MFSTPVCHTLASMSATEWSDVGVSGLPTGTVTLLLADVEGSTRLWETQPETMSAAIALLDDTLRDLTSIHQGVRPVEQGEGDSFVLAFSRASDAVACALALQRAPLAPIRLRIGINTGEIQLRDEGNYVGPTINRTARLRDLAHGGQTVLSGATESMVIDHLPADAWLTDLGSHPLRDLPRPERVVQLCHPDIRNDFPPLRSPEKIASHILPAQLTSFVGRQLEIAQLRKILSENRLVTLTGAGGAGKTRLAVEVTATLAAEFPNGLWYVDLAPITNPDVVPITTARTLGLPDQPGRSTMDILLRFIGDRKMLLLLDNCEHLLDACGQIVDELLNVCAGLTILSTSREPIGVAGELIWRVPSLSLSDEAIALFVDRARRVRPDFNVSDDNTELVAEICRRLDGMPLAIELASARVRALTLSQILDSLHDRFRLLTGGARTAVRRQQTLRASVDWSHALLTDPERVLLRRLAVFMGGFHLDAAQAVGGSTDLERYQLLDQISLLVDKSLVVAEDVHGAMRYWLLETVRQYALEKLSESGEADEVRTRHRDYYTATAVRLDSIAQPGSERLQEWAAVEIDNLRAAFAWSLENSDIESALWLVSSLEKFWYRRDRMREGLAGFDAAFADLNGDGDVPPALWVRAIADQSILAASIATPASMERAQRALAIARQLDVSALVIRTLIACGMTAFYDAALAQWFFGEATEVARASHDRRQICQIRNLQAIACCFAGDLIAAREAAEEGRDIADALGEKYFALHCRIWLGVALWLQGNLADALAEIGSSRTDVDTPRDLTSTIFGLVGLGGVGAHQGEIAAAQAAAKSLQEASEAIGGYYAETVHAVSASAALAAGDAAAAMRACEASWRHTVQIREIYVRSINPMAEAALACGDLVTARRWADEAVAVAPGSHRMVALMARAYVEIAQGESEQAERDAHEALAIAVETRGYLRLPDTLECLARLAADSGNHHYATRILGAAQGIRHRMGQVRFPMYDAGYDDVVTTVRDALGEEAFEAAWAEGAALSTEDAIAYAQRGRGERKRPSSGWASLTPTELDVVRLVSEGLPNKDIAARLFVSPRTVQTHLTHIYTKLGLASRVQLAQEAARHG